MATEVHVADIGTSFEEQILDAQGEAIDISSASPIAYKFEKPDGTVLSRTGSLLNDGTDGWAVYETVLGDLDVSGFYRLQVYVTIGSDVFHSNIKMFRVWPNLT